MGLAALPATALCQVTAAPLSLQQGFPSCRAVQAEVCAWSASQHLAWRLWASIATSCWAQCGRPQQAHHTACMPNSQATSDIMLLLGMPWQAPDRPRLSTHASLESRAASGSFAGHAEADRRAHTAQHACNASASPTWTALHRACRACCSGPQGQPNAQHACHALSPK